MRLESSIWTLALLLLAVLAPAPSHAGDVMRGKQQAQREYLERFYRQFADGRAAPIAAQLPDDLSWHMIGWREDVVPFAGNYVGRRAIRDFLTRYFEAIELREYHFEYALNDGPYTTWHFRLIGFVPETGKTFDAEYVHLWQFNEAGRPTALRAYYDTQLLTEAFAQGGPTVLIDRKNLADDYRVRCSRYDVQSLVRTAYDDFYAGDVAGVLALISPDAYVYFQGKDNPVSGEYHGTAGAIQFIQNLAGTALPGAITRLYVSEGDRSDVVLFENWTVFATGKEFHVHTVNSWRVGRDDGLLQGFINYPDIDAMAAAYLP